MHIQLLRLLIPDRESLGDVCMYISLFTTIHWKRKARPKYVEEKRDNNHIRKDIREREGTEEGEGKEERNCRMQWGYYV